MKALETLLSQRWIIKKTDTKLYYEVKDAIPAIKKFVLEKLGYNIIVNPHIIKLEKIPGEAEPWMGIQEFSTIREYQMLCFILMYLEDKEIEQQFVLSNITEYIQLCFDLDEIDWTVFTIRKQLVTVIKYCIKIGIIYQNDGDEEGFAHNINTEVLYENTGVSRYFLRHFGIDIFSYNNPEDFATNAWFDVEEDRGLVRRQRVYRRLLLSPGVYRKEDGRDDFGYIRNYRYQIEQDFQTMFLCHLDVHKTSAFIILADETTIGKLFPRNVAIDDILLALFDTLQKRRKKDKIIGDQWMLLHDDFIKIIQKQLAKIHEYLPKKYRLKELITLTIEMIGYMENYGFIEMQEESVLINPIIGKIKGEYEIMEEMK